MKKYDYFISYVSIKNNVERHGNLVFVSEKINNILRIREIEEYVRDKFNHDNVVITNFKKLGDFFEN